MNFVKSFRSFILIILVLNGLNNIYNIMVSSHLLSRKQTAPISRFFLISVSNFFYKIFQYFICYFNISQAYIYNHYSQKLVLTQFKISKQNSISFIISFRIFFFLRHMCVYNIHGRYFILIQSLKEVSILKNFFHPFRLLWRKNYQIVLTPQITRQRV